VIAGKHGQKTDQKASGNILHDLSRLPIFLLAGGHEEARANCGRALMDALAKRSLTGVILRWDDRCHLSTLALMASRYDVVVVNSDLHAPEQPMTLTTLPELDGGDAQWVLSLQARPAEYIPELLAKLADYGNRTPVWGCILIGGKSSRMGRPKHLLQDKEGKTWLENSLTTLRPLLDGLVVSGGGDLPSTVSGIQRIPDIPGVAGPLTGILAVGRWQPLVSWLLVACDMPYISLDAVTWLLAGRRPGCWGRVPKMAGNDRLEPLLAWYDFRAMHLFEDQAYRGNLRIGEAAANMRMERPIIPETLCNAWKNINTPRELHDVER
jgi:molybdopterin-guanine dinucleotide biosynthesis protein A